MAFGAATKSFAGSGKPTRLGGLCEGVVESGWLFALVVTPLLFNVHSTSSFELDKTSALRAVALLIALAWAIRELDGWLVARETPADARPPRRVRSLARTVGAHPFVALGLLVLATEVLATVTSMAPHLSLWGSSSRHQGLSTTSAYLVVFFALLRFLRTREQAERLVTTALLVSLPVSLYGIIQHAGADPVPWTGGVSGRVASTLGNPIFAGAYLIMVVPLAVYRYLDSGRRAGDCEGERTRAVLALGGVATLLLQIAAWRQGPLTGSLVALTTLFIWSAEALLLRKPLLPFLRLGGYNVLLSAQLACLLLTESRGPGLGLAAGLTFFGLLWTVSRARWRWAAAITASGLAAVLAIALMHVAGPRVPGLRDVPYAGRFAELPETTGRVRLLIWEAAGRLMASDPLRVLVGHGPDTMGLAILPHMSPALGQADRRGATADRAHNLIVDTLVATGVPGLAARLLLFWAVFVGGLRALRLLRRRRDRRVLLACCLAGAMAAPLLAGALDRSWRLAGAAFMLGTVAGMFGWILMRAVQSRRGHERPRMSGVDATQRLLIIAVLSAILAHLVEVQFGFGVAATRTYFWMYVAVLAVAPRLGRREAAAFAAPPILTAASREAAGADSPPPSGAIPPLRPGDVIAISGVAGLVLMTVLYDFLSPLPQSASLPVLLWMCGVTWGVGGLLCLTEIRLPPERGPALSFGRACGAYAGVTLLVALFIGAVFIYPGLQRMGVDLTLTPWPYYASVVVVLAAMAAALRLGVDLPTTRTTGTLTAIAGVLLAPAAGALVLASSVDAVRADVSHKRAVIASAREPARAVELARRAVSLGPARDAYHGTLGQLLVRQAMQARRTDADGLLREAETILLAAEQLSPRDPEHATSLGRLYEAWAEHEVEPARRAGRLRRATDWHTRALARSPQNVRLWNNLGAAHAGEREYARALDVYQRSLALDDRFAETYLQIGDLRLVQGRWEAAATAYRQALARNPNSVRGRVLHALAIRVAEAVREHERILEQRPDDVASLQALASVYGAAGDFDAALAHATRALAVAPQASGRRSSDSSHACNSVASTAETNSLLTRSDNVPSRAK
jgi:tetratricopeptide (TPR) repeat protein